MQSQCAPQIYPRLPILLNFLMTLSTIIFSDVLVLFSRSDVVFFFFVTKESCPLFPFFFFIPDGVIEERREPRDTVHTTS